MTEHHNDGDFRARWVRTSVAMLEHEVFEGCVYDRRSAWLWLIAKAAWKPHRIRNKGTMVTIERGQCLAGLQFLADTWGWSVKKVRNFMADLEAENMIKMGKSKGHYANIVTICNYGKYQDVPQVQGAGQGQEEGKSGARAGQDSTSTTNLTISKNTSSSVLVEAARDVAALPVSDLKAVTERLLEACNGALDNPVNCQGLLNIAVPRMWLEQGCDLERDVIPTLQAIGKRDHGKRIRSWDYFTRAVAEAKAKRVAGLPAVSLKSGAAAKPVSTFFAPRNEAALAAAKDRIAQEYLEEQKACGGLQ